MKEELKELKDVAVKIVKETDEFRKQKNFFNMKVEEKKLELNIEEILCFDAPIARNMPISFVLS